MIISGSTYVIGSDITAFLFLSELYSLVLIYVYHIVFMRSIADGQSGGFHVMTVESSFAIMLGSMCL